MKAIQYILLLLLFFSCSKEEATNRTTSREVEYRMTYTNARHQSVSYHNEDERLWADISPLPVNWSRKFVPNRKPFHALLRGGATANENETATVTVEILVNGKVVKAETQSGRDLFVVIEYTVD